METFQENLRTFRERLGVNAKEFAAAIGLPYTKYIAYENKGVEPKYDTLIKIAAALHVSIDDLLGYQPDKVEYWITLVRRAGLMVERVPMTNEIVITTPWGGSEVFSVERFTAIMQTVTDRAEEINETINEKILVQAVGYAFGRPFIENQDGTLTAQRPTMEEIQHESARLAQQQNNAFPAKMAQKKALPND